MSEDILTIDSKGRIQVPKKLRERLGVKKTVKARISDNKLIIEPSRDPLEELADQVDFTFTSILEELPTLRRVVEKQLIRETA
jgi:AbrB family looped-hinge helix DNA binding protein